MLENLLQERRGSLGPGTCKIRTIIRNLEPADADILSTALADVNKYSTHGIFQTLREAGIDVGYATLDRHRKNLCACRGNDA